MGTILDGWEAGMLIGSVTLQSKEENLPLGFEMSGGRAQKSFSLKFLKRLPHPP